MINYNLAEYINSAFHLKDLPADEGKEVAFVGRSNSGKSSSINALTRRTRLVHTSKTPGRTQTINSFRLSDTQRLMDLPGYAMRKYLKVCLNIGNS